MTAVSLHRRPASDGAPRTPELSSSIEDGVKLSMIVCARDRASRLPHFLSAVAGLEAARLGWKLLLGPGTPCVAADDIERVQRMLRGQGSPDSRPRRS